MAGSVAARLQAEYAGLIHQSGEHLHTVINDILDLAKVDAGKLDLHEESGYRPPQLSSILVSRLVKSHAVAGSLQLSVETDDHLHPICAPTRRD